MSKAILVIDIPDDIWANKEEDLGMYAEAWSRRIDNGWCAEYYSGSLKPMPEKELIWNDNDDYQIGWNACIDEILGDTE